MFKVGDKVIITKNRANSAPVTKGQTGTIQKRFEHNYLILMDNNHKAWFFTKDNLKLESIQKEFKNEADYYQWLADRE